MNDNERARASTLLQQAADNNADALAVLVAVQRQRTILFGATDKDEPGPLLSSCLEDDLDQTGGNLKLILELLGDTLRRLL